MPSASVPSGAKIFASASAWDGGTAGAAAASSSGRAGAASESDWDNGKTFHEDRRGSGPVGCGRLAKAVEGSIGPARAMRGARDSAPHRSGTHVGFELHLQQRDDVLELEPAFLQAPQLQFVMPGFAGQAIDQEIEVA